MEDKSCPKCGANVTRPKGTASVCGPCGTPIPKTTQEPEPCGKCDLCINGHQGCYSPVTGTEAA